MSVFDDWTIPRQLWDAIRPVLRPGMATLETGSGLSTLLFDAAGCRHTALEHDRRFAAPSDSVVLVPLVGCPPWYDWQPPPERSPWQMILIDGPPKDTGGREGILRVIDRLVGPTTRIALDDTDRKEEDRLAALLARRFGMRRHDCQTASGRRFSILGSWPPP